VLDYNFFYRILKISEIVVDASFLGALIPPSTAELRVCIPPAEPYGFRQEPLSFL
jgi:hypothetical protein